MELTSQALARGHARRWRFDLGVFTNLSPDHLKTHGTYEHYLASKAQLFIHLGPGRPAILNASDPCALLLDQVIPGDVPRVWYAAPWRGPALRPPDLAARAIEVDASGTAIALEPGALAEALGGALEIAMIGEVFAEDALAAAAASIAAGVPGGAARRALAGFPGLAGRFEVVARAPLVIVDYAHAADALARVCRSARELARGGRVILVFGAGGETGHDKRGPMGEAVGAGADLAIVTSDNPRGEDPAAIAAALREGCVRGGRAEVEVELDRRRAIARALDRAGPRDVVVVAGKGHETGQTIAGVTTPFSDQAVLRGLMGSESA
ncbi:MAG: Mur ligase family protein [Nannocystaceae bacterium]